MITSYVIAILMALGIITSDADYTNASKAQQDEYHIIIDDDLMGG